MAEAIACSITLLIMLVGTYASVYASEMMMPTVAFLRWAPEMLLFLLTCLAIGAMAHMSVSTRWKSHESHDLRRTNIWLHVHLKLFGLVLFYVVLIAMDIIGIAADSSCIARVVRICRNNHIRTERVLALICRFARMTFATVAVGFCYKFRIRHLLRSTVTLIRLSVVLAATLAQWLYWLLDESISSVKNRNGINLTLELCNLTVPPADNASTDELWTTPTNTDLECLHRHSPEYTFTESVSPFLYPCVIEFLMLLAECIFGLFFGSVRRQDVLRTRVSRISPDNDSVQFPSVPSGAHDENETAGRVYDVAANRPRRRTYGAVDGTRQEREINDEARVPTAYDDGDNEADDHVNDKSSQNKEETLARNETDRLENTGRHQATAIETTTRENDLHSDLDDSEVPLLRPPDRRPEDRLSLCNLGNRLVVECPWIPMILQLSTSANVVFVVLGVMASEIDTEHDHKYWRIFVYYKIGFFWPMLLLSVLFAHLLTRRFVADHNGPSLPPPKGFEYFVIMCTIGNVFYCVLSIVAAIETDDDECPTGACLVEEILNLTQVFVQTVFYFYAKRIQAAINGHGSQALQQLSFRLRRDGFRVILLLFAISNLALWLEDSFVDVRNVEKAYQVESFGVSYWSYIYYVVNPLALMFRFNSVILFIDVYNEHHD